MHRMPPYAATLYRHYPTLSRFRALPGKSFSLFSHPSRVPAAPVQLGSELWRSHFSISCRTFPSPSSSFHRCEMGMGQLDSDHYRRFSVVPESGSGGFTASGGGNCGGKGRGDNDGAGGESGGDKWSLLSWYLDLLAKFPVLTKAVTSALLTFVGDLICQIAIDQVPSLDLKRNFLFSFLGLVLVGPTLHFWYLYLSKLVTVPGASGALIRLLLDQFIFAPIFIGVFLSTLVSLEGRPSQVVPKLQQEWFSSVLVNWQLWIPFQFLNFRFVPQQFQVLAANVVALVWNVVLSFKAHKEILTK